MKAQIIAQLTKLDQQFQTQAATLPVTLKPNFTRTLGQYVYHPMKRFHFATSLATDEAMLRQVVIHEYIHYYLDIKFGIHGHGAAFREMCVLLGIPPRATITWKQAPPKVVNQHNYAIRCNECQHIIAYRQKMTTTFQQKLLKAQVKCNDCQKMVKITILGKNPQNQGTHK